MMDWIMPAALGLALVGYTLYARQRKIKDDENRPNVVVDLYGDSVLFGYPYPASQRPIQFIRSSRPNWTVRDHTAGGLDTLELLNGYSTSDPGLPSEWQNGPQPPFASVDRTGVHVCVIQTGFNDAFHSVPNYEQTLRSVVQIALNEGRKVVLTGVFKVEINVPLVNPYNEITHKIAREFNLVHVGWGEDYYPSDVHPDTVHRTLSSQDRMTSRLIEGIERAIN